jgi:hypothetical protein
MCVLFIILCYYFVVAVAAVHIWDSSRITCNNLSENVLIYLHSPCFMACWFCTYIICFLIRKEVVQTMHIQTVRLQLSTLSARKSIWGSLLINFLSSSYHHWWKGKPWHVNGKPLSQVRVVVCITQILNHCPSPGACSLLKNNQLKEIPDDGGSTHLWNVGRQSFYTAV